METENCIAFVTPSPPLVSGVCDACLKRDAYFSWGNLYFCGACLADAMERRMIKTPATIKRVPADFD